MKERMIGYLPGYYADIYEAQALVGAEAKAIGQLDADIADVLAQFSVATATWGLAYWEALVGILPQHLETSWKSVVERGITYRELERYSWQRLAQSFTVSVEERRAEVKSKLQGYGTITKSEIKNICALYAGGTVDVIENYPEYEIVVRFTDVMGVPTNIASLQAVLRELLPAHLAITFEYKYVLYAQTKATFATYGDMKTAGKTYSEILNGG